MAQLSSLRINRIVIHDIPKYDDTGNEPILSTSCANLDAKAIAALQKRIVDVLGSHSHSLEMFIQDKEENSTYHLISQMQSTEDDQFVLLSQQLANKLSQSQRDKRIPGGALLVFGGTCDVLNFPIIGIIKAEPQDGFNKVIKDGVVDINFIDNLLLTPAQKLYKIAVFVNENPEVVDDDINFWVKIFDHNMTNSETQNAARYFHLSFLGCNYSPTDKKLTRDFFNVTRDFFEEVITNPEDKVDAHNDLVAYMRTQEPTLSPVDFAARHLVEEHRAPYEQFLEEKGIPARDINKDTTYIKSKLRTRKIRFSNGIQLQAPAENFNDLVQILEQTSKYTKLQINGIISQHD